MNRKLRIIFLGTPEFAVHSLQTLYEEGFDIAAVVTAPDAPTGRGLQLKPVKTYAQQKDIPILQPEKLKDESFLLKLKSYGANLQVVVAFRMLPEAVWAMPELGTFNLHASLLPQYRGAAPINRVIMNGETVTGVTTFFLKQEIDTGSIIFQEQTEIGKEETAGELHERLKVLGAQLVVKTVREIETGPVTVVNQKQLMIPGVELKTAPKIFKEDCHVDWSQPVFQVFNQVRGLSPVPGAFSVIIGPEGNTIQVKFFRASPESSGKTLMPGKIDTDGKNYLKIACIDGWLIINEIQQSGKRRMRIQEFLIGSPVNASYMAVSEY